MKIDLSIEAINIIKSELEHAHREISWELATLSPSHPQNSDIIQYWKERQRVIHKALGELRGIEC